MLWGESWAVVGVEVEVVRVRRGRGREELSRNGILVYGEDWGDGWEGETGKIFGSGGVVRVCVVPRT